MNHLVKLLVSVAIASSCGGGESVPSLSAAGERGRQISNGNGCGACHGTSGEGGVGGPAFVGLAGAEVELTDGTFVTADEAYLVRSIVEPAADVRAGYVVRMPDNRLSEREIADVIAYIEDLSSGGG